MEVLFSSHGPWLYCDSAGFDSALDVCEIKSVYCGGGECDGGRAFNSDGSTCLFVVGDMVLPVIRRVGGY